MSRTIHSVQFHYHQFINTHNHKQCVSIHVSAHIVTVIFVCSFIFSQAFGRCGGSVVSKLWVQTSSPVLSVWILHELPPCAPVSYQSPQTSTSGDSKLLSGMNTVGGIMLKTNVLQYSDFVVYTHLT